ncbi:hypothetical protein [Sagittula stellata]|uniref:Acyl-CoA transferase n=1 Tax=Sagittula stellata (strain ATCC 700073 / DSM 11524 / E-37) TaxID=388399 RepID=A3K201_SAGS3|nr:hypothetical protein [Sagittula stellata]EBA08947.1 hypothetical protein SSE37_04855 [Sagittula stellata E-37]
MPLGAVRGAIETRLAALHRAVAAAVTPGVLRNAVLPQAIPGAGLVIMRDGVPDLAEVTLPLTYHYDHRVAFEIYTQASEDRETLADVIRQELGAAIHADRGLDGLCDWVEAQPTGSDDIRVEGGETLRVDTIVATLSYGVADPLT